MKLIILTVAIIGTVAGSRLHHALRDDSGNVDDVTESECMRELAEREFFERVFNRVVQHIGEKVKDIDHRRYFNGVAVEFFGFIEDECMKEEDASVDEIEKCAMQRGLRYCKEDFKEMEQDCLREMEEINDVYEEIKREDKIGSNKTVEESESEEDLGALRSLLRRVLDSKRK